MADGALGAATGVAANGTSRHEHVPSLLEVTAKAAELLPDGRYGRFVPEEVVEHLLGSLEEPIEVDQSHAQPIVWRDDGCPRFQIG